jgi:pentatricopeptide repeat protein
MDSLPPPAANPDAAPPVPASHSERVDKSVKEAGPKDNFEIPVELFAKRHQAPLKALNSVLNLAVTASGGRRPRRPLRSPSQRPRPLKDVWKAYLLCRNAIQSAPHMIPQQVWQVLWNLFEVEGADNLDRMSHIKSLGEEMSKADISLSPSQSLLYIESIFVAGDKSIALREWEAAKYLQDDGIHFKEYWELGVRMLCQVGQVDRAMRVAARFLHGDQEPGHSRILLPIIQASLNSKAGFSIQRAWALYIRLRINLGPQMTMDDYDAVTSMFLTANQPDLALGAFKDMMLTGSISAAEQDSTALYKKTVDVGELSSIELQNRELGWENSRVLAKLPVQFNNRFFFGSWIKKLIGEGELDAAKQVFDLMQTRQIKPDAKHMNGLIGAWLRQRTERSRILAEDMAWKMIQARLDLVTSQDVSNRLQSPIRVLKTLGLPDKKSVSLIPAATIETFAILVEQYRRRQKPQLMSDLFDALRRARVKPNTFFMNELLLSDTRAHHTNWAWDTYYSLTRKTGVRPDFDTYKILWNLMKRAMDPIIGLKPDKQPASFTTCRKLFADMVGRETLLTSKEHLPREVYNLVILSFSLALDQVGTAVALRALQRYFGMYPNEETARTVVMQLARFGLADEFGNKPKRLDLQSPVTKERIANVTRILGTFKNQRIEVLAQQGIVYDQLRGPARSEESLLLLSDLLRYVARARIAAEERHNYNAAIASERAAEQMGVPDCVPWVENSKGEVKVL